MQALPNNQITIEIDGKSIEKVKDAKSQGFHGNWRTLFKGKTYERNEQEHYRKDKKPFKNVFSFSWSLAWVPDSRRSRQEPNVDFRDCESFTENWYRFQGAAGTRMPTKCPPIGNSQFPVWLNVESNRLPYKGEGVKTDIKVCFPDCCRIDRHFEISVKNFSSYLIYKLGQMTTLYFFPKRARWPILQSDWFLARSNKPGHSSICQFP